MRTHIVIVALGALSLSACTVNLAPADEAQIKCSSDAECPGELVCAQLLGVCVVAGSDLTPPEVAAGSLTLTRDRIAAGQQTTLAFTSTKALAREPVITFIWGAGVGESRAAVLDAAVSSDTQFSSTYTAQGDEADDTVEEVFASVVVELVDESGLRTRSEVPRALAFDFKPPNLVDDTVGVRRDMAADNPLRQLPGSVIDTLRSGSTFTLSFAVSETLSVDPSVVATGPGTLDFRKVNAAGSLYIFDHTVGTGTVSQGSYTIDVTATDLVGNVGTFSVPLSPPGFVIDTQAPTAPDAATPDTVLYSRRPWGDRLSDSSSYQVEGQAGSVPACTGVECPWIFIFDRADADDAGVLGGGRANADGSFGPIDLLRVDRPRVWVGAVDAAGNVSDASAVLAGPQASLVEDVAWYSTLAGKVRGSTLENPHRVEAISANPGGRTVAPPLATEVSQSHYDALALSDGIDAATSWIPAWSRRDNTGGPTGVLTPAAFDAQRNRLFIFGGSNGGSVTSDQWEWDGMAWLATGGAQRPASRSSHSLTYDSARGVVVLFGGCEDVTCQVSADDSGYHSDTWEWDGSTWAEVLTVGPTPRFAAAIAYDPIRNYVLLFGGRDNTSELSCAGESSRYCADTWAYTTWGEQVCGEVDRPCWQELTPTSPTNVPFARGDAAMAYDQELGRVVMFGGRNLSQGGSCGGSSSYCGDGFSWDGSEWQTIAPGPEERSGAVLVPEPANTGLLLLGGRGPSDCTESGSSYCKSAWRWSGGAWADVTASNIPVLSRSGLGAAYSPGADTLLTFGGFTDDVCPGGGTLCKDLQEFDGVEWRERGRSGRKSNQCYAREVVFHGGGLQRPLAFQNEAFFHGSQTTCDSAPSASCIQTHALIAEGWEEVGTTASTFPVPRTEAGMVYDPSRDMTILYGGRRYISTSPANQRFCAGGTSPYCQDAMGFSQFGSGTCGSASAYCWASLGNPGRRYGHGMAYVDSTEQTLVLGGRASNGAYVDTVVAYGSCGRFDCWGDISASVAGPAPSSRAHAAVAYDALADRIVLFGGEGSGGLLGDTWTLLPGGSCGESYCWQELNPAGPPAPRSHGTLTYDPDRGRVVLFGGYTDGVVDTLQSCSGTDSGGAELWELVGDEWRLLSSLNQPLGRGGAGLVSLAGQQQLLMFAGRLSDRDSAGRAHDWFLSSSDESTPAFGVDLDWTAAVAGVVSGMTLSATLEGGGQGNGLDPATSSVVPGIDVRVWNVIEGRYDSIGASNNFTPISTGIAASGAVDATSLVDGNGIVRLLLIPTGGVGHSYNVPTVAVDGLEVRVDYRIVP